MGGVSMNLEEQFNWITGLLNQDQVPYWIDSGTLLGVIRDGKILEHDKDIDLGIWAENEKYLQKIVRTARKAGYRVIVFSFRGMNYKYKFIPPCKTKLFKISINLFRKLNGYAWCPQEKLLKRQQYPGRWKPHLFRLCKFFTIYFYRKHFARRISFSSKIWRLFYEMGTWWIPAFYFEKIISLKEKDTYIPEKWESYLEFRYGNWRVPDKGWNFWRNDKTALKHVPPEVLLKI